MKKRPALPFLAAAKRVGQPVALSVNLPANQPEMRAFAERRLLQELEQLELVSKRTGTRQCMRAPEAGPSQRAELALATLQVRKAAGLDLQGAS